MFDEFTPFSVLTQPNTNRHRDKTLGFSLIACSDDLVASHRNECEDRRQRKIVWITNWKLQWNPIEILLIFSSTFCCACLFWCVDVESVFRSLISSISVNLYTFRHLKIVFCHKTSDSSWTNESGRKWTVECVNHILNHWKMLLSKIINWSIDKCQSGTKIRMGNFQIDALFEEISDWSFRCAYANALPQNTSKRNQIHSAFDEVEIELGICVGKVN